MKNQTNNNINIKNKRASFDYEFIDTYTAGIVLTGTEIKSIRQGKASLVDTFCFFSKGELWVKNNISMARITITWHDVTASFCLIKRNFASCSAEYRKRDLPLFLYVCSSMNVDWPRL